MFLEPRLDDHLAYRNNIIDRRVVLHEPDLELRRVLQQLFQVPACRLAERHGERNMTDADAQSSCGLVAAPATVADPISPHATRLHKSRANVFQRFSGPAWSPVVPGFPGFARESAKSGGAVSVAVSVAT
jgi:hypothetical protein